eukprot:CAMPEP_0183703008 /NCGR_PEP_ID=MMETSP0737-20130205/919_1 /TAXON_ID=385413 /ORGANISM="Thalassiosira miniscula, Strain CCMP1093" /LENGTH=135 /DNA_ID=CAMNT_0025929705 /DNA_START=120 /DNA_END=527 /DNA_ORIENTATION=-
MEHKTKVRARRRASRRAERITQAQVVESNTAPDLEEDDAAPAHHFFAGRNLQGDPCRDQVDTCFALDGCMKCKSYTNRVNSINPLGSIQCLSVAGNEELLAGDPDVFDGCCTEMDGGTNGMGERCNFWTREEDAA